MQKMPIALGMVLCERVEVNPESGLYSLSNVFIRLPWSGLGSQLKRFMVFGTLFNGKGDGLMRLDVIHMETERQIYRFSRWYTSPDSRASHPFEIPVTKCRFPEPGRYLFSLRIDDEAVACQYLDILRR